MDAAKFAASVIRRHVPDPAYRVFLFARRSCGDNRRARGGADPLYDRRRRFRVHAAAVPSGRRPADSAMTKGQSLRADFEKAVNRLDEVLASPLRVTRRCRSLKTVSLKV